jgi:diguanylate cyclase (GGDEF)-like protein
MLAEEQAQSDTLMGLRNRRSLERVLDHLAQTDESFSLIQIDLDYFKSVNDTLGHAAGNMILQHVANVLRRETRHDDFLICMGGDEFLLVIKHLTDHARLMSLSTALIRGIEDPQEYDGTPFQISASLGVLVHLGGTRGRWQMCCIVWMRRFMPQNMGGGDRRISRPDGAFKYV